MGLGSNDISVDINVGERVEVNGGLKGGCYVSSKMGKINEGIQHIVQLTDAAESDFFRYVSAVATFCMAYIF